MFRAWFLLLGLTVLALMGLFTPQGELKLNVDPSTESLIVRDEVPGLARKREVARTVLVAMFRVADQWTVDDILAVGNFAQSLKRQAGVVQVESPFTSRIPLTEGDQLEIASIMDRIKRNPSHAKEWMKLAFKEPLLQGSMINPSGNAVSLRVELNRASGADDSGVDQVVASVERFFAGQSRIDGVITGTTLAQSAIGQQIVRDLIQALGLCALIVPIVLLFSFRGLGSVLLPISSIALALLWTLGGMAWLGISLNLVTAIIPPLVIALTLAYSMHALSAHSHSEYKGDESMSRRLVMPLMVTALTTMVGFAALSLQAMPAIKNFSIAGTMGVLASVASVLLLQCYAVQGYALRVQGRAWIFLRLQSLVEFIHGRLADRREMVIGLAFLVFGLGLVGMLKIEPGARYISDLRADHPIRVSFEEVNRNFGGANGFEVVIEGAGQDAMLLPSVLHPVELFQKWLDAQPEIGDTASLVDYIKRLNQAFTTGQQEDYRLPDDFNLIKQLLIVGAPSEAQRFANVDYSQLTIQVRTPVDNTAELRGLLARVQQKIDALPTGVHGYMRGDAVALTRTVAALTSGQLLSFGVAILAVYLVISIVFASLRMGLRAMLPNLLPIAVYYGLIGLLGIPLSPTMALLACIVLGIAVDDTLFYLVRFNQAARQLASETRAAELALRQVIGPITLTTVALCLCFLTLTAGQLQTQAVFALLAAFTLIVAWVSDLTLTPAIGARSSIVTLWDVLSVDLGTAPEKTIPLFEGMTPRQAKIFALLSRIEDIAAGETFIKIGDPAGDIYVVIEGRGYAWLEQNDQEIHLAEFVRGNTFGESSTFIKHRTANVTAASDMRLLAFSPQTLDRVCRRYPWVAALVYRNVSAIQARRLDQTTRKLEELTGKMPSATAQSDA